MMRAVVTCLFGTGVLPKALTIPPDWEHDDLSREAFDNTRNMDRGTDGTPTQGKLKNSTAESSLVDLIIAQVVTRKEKQRMLQSGHSPPLQESRTPTQEPSPPTAPPGEVPPPPTTCDTAITDRNEETKGPGYTGPYVPHPSDRHVGRHGPKSGRTKRPIPDHAATDRRPTPRTAGIHEASK